MRLEKDPQIPNLYWYPESRAYYFRKRITGQGEVFRSLKTKDRNEAIRRLNQILGDFQKELPKKKRVYTVGEAAKELKAIYRGQAAATYANFEYYSRAYIQPYFETTPVQDVAKQWRPYKAWIKGHKPGMSLLHVRRHLTRILNHAVETERLAGFPKLRLDPDEVKRGTPRAYDNDEIDRVLNTEIDLKRHSFRASTIEKLRFQTELVLVLGLRPPHELRNLRWEYFDFDRGFLTIPNSFTKTRTERTIPVPSQILQTLKERRILSKSEWVFPHRLDPKKPATRSDKSWQRLKRALNFNGKRYWFRHTHGTTAIEELPEKIVVKNMGTSSRMLERVYVRPKKDSYQKQVSALVNRFPIRGKSGESFVE